MTAAAYEEARRWAAWWSQRWFLGPDGEDRLTGPDGVEAGWATHVEAYLVLLDLALQHVGVTVSRRSVLGRVKALGWDRAVRSIGLGLAPGRPRRSADSVRTVAIVGEIPTPSMLDAALLVGTALSPAHRSVAAADPRVLARLRRAGLDPEPLALPIAEQRASLRRSGRAYTEILANVTRRPPPMALAGTDLGTRAMVALRRSLGRSLPWLAPEFQAICAYADRTNARAFAVASDQHRIGRLIVQAAHRRGATVMVLQHGMPQTEVGYLPVIADKVATWSERSSQWFTERGTDPNRLEVLGNPRFDALRAAAGAEQRPAPAALRVLLALSPTEVRTNRRVVSTVLRAVAALSGSELVIKLHPGHREWEWVHQEVEAAPGAGRVRVEHRTDVASLLHWADVTLVHRSSVAVESLVARRPVIAVPSDLPSVADAELADLALPSPASAAELGAVLDSLRSPESRVQWFAHRDTRIRFHTGPTDRSSARRIADALLRPDQTFGGSGGASASSQPMG